MRHRRLAASEVLTALINPTTTAIPQRRRTNGGTKAAPHPHTATTNIDEEAETSAEASAETSADQRHRRITSGPADGSAAEPDHRDLAGQKATWLHAGRQKSNRDTDLDRGTRDTVQELQKHEDRARGRGIKGGRVTRTITAATILGHGKGGTHIHAHRRPQESIVVSGGASVIVEADGTASTSDLTATLVSGDCLIRGLVVRTIPDVTPARRSPVVLDAEAAKPFTATPTAVIGSLAQDGHRAEKRISLPETNGTERTTCITVDPRTDEVTDILHNIHRIANMAINIPLTLHKHHRRCTITRHSSRHIHTSKARHFSRVCRITNQDRHVNLAASHRTRVLRRHREVAHL